MSDLLQHLVSASALVTAVVGVILVFLRGFLTLGTRLDLVGFTVSLERVGGRRDMLGAEETVLRALLQEQDANVAELAVVTRLTPAEVETALTRLAELGVVAATPGQGRETIWMPSGPRDARHRFSLRHFGRGKSRETPRRDDIDVAIDAELARLHA